MESRSVVELLIKEVKKRPCLWDKKHDYYKNRLHVDKLWEEVAAAVDRTKDHVKIKWRNLRDQFHRELKRNPLSEAGSLKVDQYSGKWIYYDMLTFLKDFYNAVEESKDGEADDISLNNEEDLIVIKQDPDFDGQIQIEPHTFLDPLEPYEDSSNSLSTQVEPLEVPRKKLHNSRRVRSYVNRQIGIQNKRLQRASNLGKEVDEDLHFALSLVPYLRRLDPLRKLIVRNEMQNLLIGELISNSQTSSDSTQNRNLSMSSCGSSEAVTLQG